MRRSARPRRLCQAAVLHTVAARLCEGTATHSVGPPATDVRSTGALARVALAYIAVLAHLVGHPVSVHGVSLHECRLQVITPTWLVKPGRRGGSVT